MAAVVVAVPWEISDTQYRRSTIRFLLELSCLFLPFVNLIGTSFAGLCSYVSRA